MYCVNCGTPLSQGLSYCNRCGTNLREKKGAPKTAAIGAYLTAITILGVAGLGIMLGGALVLRKEAGLGQELIGVFMLFTFLIVGMVEVMLVRGLSKLSSAEEPQHYFPNQHFAPNELRAPHPGSLGEPVPSVTENTTRTLQYSRREQ
jgi:predicted nucleic acid-binding Zn ribbon protein